jgi:nucleoside triphosphatase
VEQKYPEPTVGALIFNPEWEILLVKSHKWKEKYTIPGGHIDLVERTEDALKREIKEETDLDIYDIRFIFFDFACRTD